MAQMMLTCPACGAADVDIRRFESMMVLRPNMALFTIECPHCSTRISSLQSIPPMLRKEVMHAAHELHAGMGATQGTA